MPTCDMAWPVEAHPADDVPLDEEEPCGEPATVLMRLACVHEHVREWLACTGCCVDEQMSWPASGPLCLVCGIGTQAHDCPATVTIEGLL